MVLIGVTGGVGSGKSELLRYVRDRYGAFVLFADQAAAQLMRRGQSCFDPVVRLLGPEVIGPDGELDRKKIAGRVFENDTLRESLNRIVHPAVRTSILEAVQEQKKAGTALFFLEAALLIEENYNEICQELWYVYADEDIRRERLRRSRGYSEEKITAIIRSQLPEEKFREASDFVIDNSGTLEESERQIDRRLAEILDRGMSGKCTQTGDRT